MINDYPVVNPLQVILSVFRLSTSSDHRDHTFPFRSCSLMPYDRFGARAGLEVSSLPSVGRDSRTSSSMPGPPGVCRISSGPAPTGMPTYIGTSYRPLLGCPRLNSGDCNGRGRGDKDANIRRRRGVGGRRRQCRRECRRGARSTGAGEHVIVEPVANAAQPNFKSLGKSGAAVVEERIDVLFPDPSAPTGIQEPSRSFTPPTTATS